MVRTHRLYDHDRRDGGEAGRRLALCDARPRRHRLQEQDRFHRGDKPERLIYRHAGDAETDPVRFHVTVTFAAQSSKTKLTMTSIFETAEERNRVVEKYGAIKGGKQTLGRLAEHLARLKGSAT